MESSAPRNYTRAPRASRGQTGAPDVAQPLREMLITPELQRKLPLPGCGNWRACRPVGFSKLSLSLRLNQCANSSGCSAKDKSSVFARQLVSRSCKLPAATNDWTIPATHGSVSLWPRLGRTIWRALVKDRATLSPYRGGVT